MTNAIFTAGLRTPFCTAHKGALKDTRADELLVQLLKAHQVRYAASWAASFDDVIVGCAYPEGEQGYNVARTAALGSGRNLPGMTINRLCGSSLEAVAIAQGFINAGRGTRYVVGGVESMSRIPRRGAGFSESNLVKDAFPKAYITMGETAEAVAALFPDISRGAQEDFATESHTLAHAAFARGCYQDSVLAEPVAQDEGIRFPVNREKLAALAPAFIPGGVVTAATSSPLSDGAAVGLVVAAEEVPSLGVKDGLRLLGTAVSAVAPEIMGLGPEPAVRQLLQKHGLQPSDLAAIEMNEAFAVQVLACMKRLELDRTLLNAWGGALALGHPLGASGLRLMMTLHHRLRERGQAGARGMAALCIGGGQGLAVLCEYVRFT